MDISKSHNVLLHIIVKGSSAESTRSGNLEFSGARLFILRQDLLNVCLQATWKPFWGSMLSPVRTRRSLLLRILSGRLEIFLGIRLAAFIDALVVRIRLSRLGPVMVRQ